MKTYLLPELQQRPNPSESMSIHDHSFYPNQLTAFQQGIVKTSMLTPECPSTETIKGVKEACQQQTNFSLPHQMLEQQQQND